MADPVRGVLKHRFVRYESCWATMVAQWLGTYLPTKEEGGESLVWKDSTCRGATNPMRQNY